MLKTFGRKLSALIFCGFCIVAGGALLTEAVIRKPWGVRDHDREKYDTIITELRREKQLKRDYQHASRPIMEVEGATSDKAFLELDVVQPDLELHRIVNIFNRGDQVLNLSADKKKVCGLSVELKKHAIGPGEKGTVVISGVGKNFEITLPGKEEEQTKSNRLRIRSNDPLMDSFDIFVRGRHAEKASCPPTMEVGTTDVAEEVTAECIVFSETSESLTIEGLNHGSVDLAWYVDESWNPELVGNAAVRSAIRIVVKYVPFSYGDFSVPITIGAKAGHDRIVLESRIVGRVRSPISFKSPAISKSSGLDIGTKTSGKRMEEVVAVQLRGHDFRQLEVLDYEPKQLEVTMRPIEKPGAYRLVIAIPADCPDVIFNRADRRGYVSVGDPKDPKFSSWFPLYGAVVAVDQR